MGSVEHDERSRDEDGINVEPFLERALADVVEELCTGARISGLNWGLHDFLQWQDDLHELVGAAKVMNDWKALDDEIERRLRAELADHDAVHDRAAQMANEGEE